MSWRLKAGAVILMLAMLLASCDNSRTSAKDTANASPEGAPVGIVTIGTATLERQMTQSSELVPYQEIDVYAKESGYVKKLNVDYGVRVKAGDVLAVLEIPELELQLKQDDAAIKSSADMVTTAQHELERREATAKMLRLAYDRLNGVARSKPGLVAQQEVDDAEGRALSAEAQVEASRSNVQSAQGQLLQAQARKERDQALFDYSKITAPFEGVVTQRYANLGTLLQAGTNSSTQALPLVKLSEDDRFRLVIPVPESQVRYIHDGDPVQVSVPSLNQNFPGKVARSSADVREDTRTMHTEVDVYNPNRVLYPGLYADATLTLERKPHALAVPLQALDRSGDNITVDVVTSDNKIEIRQITLGIQTANLGEVLSGLKEGEMVVVSDRSGLKSGQPVKPKTVELLQYRGQEQQ